MGDLKDKHDRAMELVDTALHAQREAYRLERECADSLEAKPEHEPTRAILYRSAGWIAVNRGYYAEGIECAKEGLKGVIHPEIRQELVDLWNEAERRQGRTHSETEAG